MSTLFRRVVVSLIMVFVVALALGKPPIQNLAFVKQQLISYHNSGQYQKDLASVYQQATEYLSDRIQHNKQTGNKKQLAVVMDIDETSLSNYPEMRQENFGGSLAQLNQAMEQGKDPAIKPALKFYRFVRAHHVAVFFLTGRRQHMRAATIKNLNAMGYHHWARLYLTPNNYHKKSIIPYKSSMRKHIEKAGYDVVLTIGDQFSDLKGGYADKTFKLPNPFYYIP